MRTHVCVLSAATVAGLAIGSIAPGMGQEKVGTCSGTQNACEPVQKLIKIFSDAFNRKDGPATAAVFAPDAVMLGEGPMISGRDAIEKMYSDGIRAGFSHLVVNTDQAHVAGDTIWAVGNWSETGPGPNTTTQPYHGNWGAVYVNNSGTWQTRMLTTNIMETPPQ
jgi:uncharacterized protein (TIGR02246 family)